MAHHTENFTQQNLTQHWDPQQQGQAHQVPYSEAKTQQLTQNSLRSPNLTIHTDRTPVFAPPPKTPTIVAQPTSTFIPNFDYHQAGFTAPPLTPVLSKGFEEQQYIYYQEPPLPSPIADIIVLNPSANDKSLLAFNTDVKKMAAQYGDGHDQQSYAMDNLNGHAGQMHFDPPPTQYVDPAPVDEQPRQQEGMAAQPSPDGAPVHAPGQISHPNQVFGPQGYKYGLCSCMSDTPTCCLGFWCPCMLYSRTHHRLKTIPSSNLDQYSNANGHCALWCITSPVAWIFTTLQRTRIRELYQIKGSPVSDCCKAYYCPVCVLVQDERQIRDMEEEKKRCAGPSSGMVGEQGYKKPEKMNYQRSSVIG